MKIQFNNKVYDVLKWVVLIVLPALSVLYASLAGLWHWPYVKEVTGTLAAIEMFIGALIGVSCVQYGKNNGNG